MSRYINADSLYQKINTWRDEIKIMYEENDEYVECLGYVLTIIETEPNADVVEVVRCKDCENIDKDDLATRKKECFCYYHAEYKTKDYFCASGKRRKKQ